MNWFGLYIGDWLKKTQELTLLQEGVYLRLVCWCYAHELPLPVKPGDIYRIARATNQHEREAITIVLHKHFELQADGWHNARCDRELQKRGFRSPLAQQHQTDMAHRQKRSREKRQNLLLRITAAGIVASPSAPMRELEALAETCCATRDTQRDGVDPSRVAQSINDAAHSTLHTTAVLNSTAGVTASVTAARAGAACLAMRKAGLATTSPSDPRLLAVLDAGASDEHLAITAREAVIRGKGWGWVLSTVAGQMQDAAQIGKGPRRPLERAESAAEASARAWAPSLFVQSDLERLKGSQ